jgi:hypothetical protein
MMWRGKTRGLEAAEPTRRTSTLPGVIADQ